MFKLLGADTGFDAIDDQPVAVSINRFFSRLDQEGLLAKTIVYNLNPRDTELMVANAYNFNDGSVPGRCNMERLGGSSIRSKAWKIN